MKIEGLSEAMQWSLENQEQLAKEYKEQKELYKLTKNRAEKAKAKALKKLSLICNQKTDKEYN